MQPLLDLIETNFKELDKVYLFDFIVDTIDSPLMASFIDEQVQLKNDEIKQELRKLVPEEDRIYRLWFEMIFNNGSPILSFSCDFNWISLKQIQQIQSSHIFELSKSYRDECTYYKTKTKLRIPIAYFYIQGILENDGNSWTLNSKSIEQEEIRFFKFYLR